MMRIGPHRDEPQARRSMDHFAQNQGRRNAGISIAKKSHAITQRASSEGARMPLPTIRNPRLLYLKGGLFLLLGLLAAGGLLLDHPSLKTAILLLVSIWAFARSYYFAFYVIQHYIDPGYRFAGLWDFARYLLRSQNRRKKGEEL
jgi:uncharacterized RDD family membrane protein YckC